MAQLLFAAAANAPEDNTGLYIVLGVQAVFVTMFAIAAILFLLRSAAIPRGGVMAKSRWCT